MNNQENNKNTIVNAPNKNRQEGNKNNSTLTQGVNSIDTFAQDFQQFM